MIKDARQGASSCKLLKAILSNVEAADVYLPAECHYGSLNHPPSDLGLKNSPEDYGKSQRIERQTRSIEKQTVPGVVAVYQWFNCFWLFVVDGWPVFLPVSCLIMCRCFASYISFKAVNETVK